MAMHGYVSESISFAAGLAKVFYYMHSTLVMKAVNACMAELYQLAITSKCPMCCSTHVLLVYMHESTTLTAVYKL